MNEKKEFAKAERVKIYRQALAAHKPKNRSSKHLRCLTGMKSIWRCLSGDALREMSGKGCFPAGIELDRREKNRDKREARMARYRAKLEAKRAAKA